MILGRDVLSNPDLRLKLKNASFLKWQSNEDDQARFQGRVVGVLDEGLKVNYYEWLLGEENEAAMISDMELEHYIFFDSTMELKANAHKSMPNVISQMMGETA